MVKIHILLFLYWENTFHVHVYELSIAVGEILAQTGAWDLSHHISSGRIKFSKSKNNYNTMEREGLDMVYALHKSRHYLLGKHFKIFTDHSSLKHLVNKPMLGGNICRWLLLFQ